MQQKPKAINYLPFVGWFFSLNGCHNESAIMVLVADEAEESDVILLRRFIEDLSNPVDMVSDGSTLFLLIVEINLLI